MSEIDVALRGLTKRFGDMTAVDNLNLEIPRGGFFALLGPSGCGKTTALRMIGGFEEPTAGTIELAGEEITQLPPHKRDVNTVFQSYALFPHMTVAENVSFGLACKKVPKAERASRVAEALELVELSALAARRPAQMSGGQQQRVALARALVNRPRALLLDEPLGALDLRLRKQLQIELSQIQREVGITFIHVTHDQEEAMTMADTIAVMRDGRIDQLGSAEELYERPRTQFVANFLGHSNLVDAKLLSSDGPLAEFDADGGTRLRAPASAVSGLSTSQLRVGVRPEKMTLAAANGGSAQSGLNALFGHVTEQAYIGLATQYLVRSDGGAELQIFVQNSGSVSSSFAQGERVVVTWAPEHTFVVERED